MRVVINQSNYIPWKGYFDLIHDADLFIFLDDVQYTHRDWRNRNRIKTPNGLHWLTIPVGNADGRMINQVALPQDDWGKRHWDTIRRSYASCAHFESYAQFFEDFFLRQKWTTLSAFNQALILSIARDILKIKPTFMDSASLGIQAAKQDRIIGLLKAVGATSYLSGPAAKDYLDPIRFKAEGIDLLWKDYSGYQEYPQLYPPFQHNVSILDLIFHTGPSAPDFIWGSGRFAAPAP